MNHVRYMCLPFIDLPSTEERLELIARGWSRCIVKRTKQLLIKVLIEYSDILDQGSIKREIAVYSKYLRRIRIYLVQNSILDSKLLTRDEILTYF